MIDNFLHLLHRFPVPASSIICTTMSLRIVLLVDEVMAAVVMLRAASTAAVA